MANKKDDNIQHGIDDNPHGDAQKGAALGGLGGAAVGAAAGSVIGPVGTLIGAAVGGLAGAVGSGAAVGIVDQMDDDNTVTGIGDSSNAHATVQRNSDDFVVDAPAATGGPIIRDTETGALNTGGPAMNNANDTRGVTERVTDAVTGDRIDDKTGQPVANMGTANNLNTGAVGTNTNLGTNTVTTDRNLSEGPVAVPVVEEELQVGKREVAGGGVRVTSHVTEKPVEAQVNLREEHVIVDRHAVDRPATEADLRTAANTTIEMTETREQAIVNKEARVVEEVVVGKEVNQHTETVQDTVRHTDVDVQQLSGTAAHGFEAHENDFRSNFQSTYGNTGRTYDHYQPAYRYGHELANDTRYANSDWNTVEADAGRSWSERNSGSWNDYRDAARFAWEKARNRR